MRITPRRAFGDGTDAVDMDPLSLVARLAGSLAGGKRRAGRPLALVLAPTRELATLREQLAAQTALVAAQQSRFDLSDLRYRNGVDSYLVVLLAQQDLYTAQQTLIQTRLTRLANLITLYKALGGGWQAARS
mgnify:CR=1 FL=1